MESHHHGNLQRTGGLHGRRSHGAFRSHVYHIRPFFIHLARNLSAEGSPIFTSWYMGRGRDGIAVSPGSKEPFRSEALITCTRCPRIRRPPTRRPSVRATPFISGSYVSVTTSILMYRYHERNGFLKQDAAGNETVTNIRLCSQPRQINSRSGAIPPRPSRFPVRVRIMSPLFYQDIFQNCVLLQKRNSPLNIKRSQSMRVHLRISNPQSIKFFEKKGLSSYREKNHNAS